VIITVPIRLVSEANSRGHWAVKARRVKSQRKATAVALWTEGGPMPSGLVPCVVTITRVAPRQLDLGDNLAVSAKAVRDEVAKWLRVDDGPGSPVSWRYGQRKGEPGEYACEIRIEPTKEAA
jgi:hypothetical protein